MLLSINCAMDSGTTFKFRGYSGKRSGAAVSSLFLDYDDDDDDRIYDLDANIAAGSRNSVSVDSNKAGNVVSNSVTSNSEKNIEPPARYNSPADLCRLTDTEEIAGAVVSSSAEGAAAERGAETREGNMCFDVPDAALSSCVWVGSSLLSRMLFQIYNEMGDESKTNTWYFQLLLNPFIGCDCIVPLRSPVGSPIVSQDADCSWPRDYSPTTWRTLCSNSYPRPRR